MTPKASSDMKIPQVYNYDVSFPSQNFSFENEPSGHSSP